tara:strand:- start:5901 stop:6698 length:798 start_codon:yes stop_codon:yes gene_type:complete
MNKMCVVSLVLLASISALSAQNELDEHFKNFRGTIVVHDQKSNIYTIFNEERAKTRYSPFSTYKIPHSIIALETRVISDTDQIVRWDKQAYPREDWWPKTWGGEHNLKSAIKYSVVPVYRHIAKQIDREKMKSYVASFDYGNRDISSGTDNFWLNGSLRISALEQIEFLKKFYNGQLKVSPRTIKLVKSILIQEQTEDYTLSAKTGGGNMGGDQRAALGWYVGYVEKSDNVYFFALNIEGQNFTEILEPRLEITKNVLEELGIVK